MKVPPPPNNSIVYINKSLFLDHFNAVGEAILSAKSEIYIADWWLSPELVKKNEMFLFGGPAF